MRPSSPVRCGAGQGSLWVSVSPPGKRAPSWDFAIGVSGGPGPPHFRVTRRAHGAYLRPSDLSCRFLPAAAAGGALARLLPGLPEGGAGALWGGAGGGTRGPDSVETRVRGLRPGPTRALRCQVSKHRVLGFVPHFPQLFVWPFFPERPLGGGGSWVSLSPPGPECGQGRRRDPRVPGTWF